MSVLQKLHRVLYEAGFSGLILRVIASCYREGIRPLLPGWPVHYAGIPVSMDRKWGDDLIPPGWLPRVQMAEDFTDNPQYEAALVAGLRRVIRPGDRVVVVGGGIGVTVVIAALQTGPLGTVLCFEGSSKYVKHIKRTAARNNVNNVSVHHAIVGNPVSIFDQGDRHTSIIHPRDLPECDVLELDCEGSEIEILRKMTIKPRAILVEAHGNRGAPTSEVASLLHGLGYVTADPVIAEPSLEEYCKQNDIQVLVGTKSD